MLALRAALRKGVALAFDDSITFRSAAGKLEESLVFDQKNLAKESKRAIKVPAGDKQCRRLGGALCTGWRP